MDEELPQTIPHLEEFVDGMPQQTTDKMTAQHPAILEAIDLMSCRDIYLSILND